MIVTAKSDDFCNMWVWFLFISKVRRQRAFFFCLSIIDQFRQYWGQYFPGVILLIQIGYVIRAGIHIILDKIRQIYQNDTFRVGGDWEGSIGISLRGANIFAWFIFENYK